VRILEIITVHPDDLEWVKETVERISIEPRPSVECGNSERKGFVTLTYGNYPGIYIVGGERESK
jgi:hypothetical protein